MNDGHGHVDGYPDFIRQLSWQAQALGIANPQARRDCVGAHEASSGSLQDYACMS